MCLVVRETSPQMVLNLLKAKENVNVPLDCPAAKKPQQIVATPAKPNHKHKVDAHILPAAASSGRQTKTTVPKDVFNRLSPPGEAQEAVGVTQP